MSNSFNLDRECTSASPDEAAAVDHLSNAERQDLLAELARRLDAWRAQLSQPTRDQMLGTAHQENRMLVEFGHDTPEFWDGLEAEWRRKQKPDFAHFQAYDSWPRPRDG